MYTGSTYYYQYLRALSQANLLQLELASLSDSELEVAVCDVYRVADTVAFFDDVVLRWRDGKAACPQPTI